MSLVYLSYPLDEETPAYGGGESLRIEQTRSIRKGDSADAALWRLPNHLGTHIDFPRHFVSGGKGLDDYGASFFEFSKIGIVHLGETTPGAIIGPQQLGRREIPVDAEMILVVTGFFRLRRTRDYWEKNPVFAPEIADLIRGRFRAVRVFGFDTISLSSWTDRETGRRAHRAFLDDASPILPLEDMDLSPLGHQTRIGRLSLSPLRVRGADAAPTTVIADVGP